VLKKTITYINPFTEQEVTEDHYFHISKADLIEMEMVKKGGMEKYLKEIIKSEDGKAIIAEFKKLLKLAYGKRDGDTLIKSERNWEEFYSSEAYSQLFTELCTDADAAAVFINGIVPHTLSEEAAKISSDIQNLPESSKDPTGLTNDVTPRVLTQAEITDMDSDELKSGLATGRYKLS
jgi:hypothetical protein